MCTPVLRPASVGEVGRLFNGADRRSGSRSLTEIVRGVPSDISNVAMEWSVQEHPTEPTLTGPVVRTAPYDWGGFAASAPVGPARVAPANGSATPTPPPPPEPAPEPSSTRPTK